MDDEDDDFDDVEGFEIREPHITRGHADYESLDDDDSDYFSADDDEEDDEDEDLDEEDSEDLDDAFYRGR